MSQPVKLSDALVLDARIAGKYMERSIAGQVEFWARLGKVVENILEGAQARALSEKAHNLPLEALEVALKSVDSPEGRRRTEAYLKSLPFPQYEPHPTTRGILIRIDADGVRTEGRFVNRQFRPAPARR